MDGVELFRKLGAGAKFDFSKFETDARKFKLIKNVPEKANIEPKESWISSNTNNCKPENQREKTELLKCPQNKVSVQKEESEINLLGNITAEKTKKIWLQSKRSRKFSHEKLAKMRQEEINHFRKIHHIYVYGTDIPDPIESFDDLCKEYGLCSLVLENISQLGYSTPTPIQMQVMPLILHKREVLACAPTGSGKTAAFLIPLIQNLKEPQKLGFRAVVISPTRELAKQIYQACVRLSSGTGLKVRLISKVSSAAKKFGPNSSKKCDILITTPNRLVYMLQQDPPLICLNSVEWLIIDESDKLFEAGKRGFCDQLAVIYKACSSINVRRAMFSATFAHEVEEWCKLNLDSVVTVSIGVRNSVADLVQQELLFVGNESGKLLAFRDLIKKGLTPPVLVFVQSKERAKELFNELIYDGINVDVIHADRTQLQRDNVVRSFRSGNIWVLICTELMGRGIDFKGVNLVVNYDFPSTSISYIHRIGRTGRAGRPGHAITYFTEEDVGNLRSIAQVMKNSGCKVPEYMLKLKKPSKKRKNTSSVPIQRKKITTVSDYDVEKKAKKIELIKNSKRRKLREMKKKRL